MPVSQEGVYSVSGHRAVVDEHRHSEERGVPTVRTGGEHTRSHRRQDYRGSDRSAGTRPPASGPPKLPAALSPPLALPDRTHALLAPSLELGQLLVKVATSAAAGTAI